MADTSLGLSRKPRSFEGWMWYVLMWGVVAPTILALVALTAIEVLAILAGATAVPRWVSSTLGVGAFLGYYPVTFQLVWKEWLKPRGEGRNNVRQIGKQNASSHGGTAIAAQDNANITVHNHHYPPAAPRKAPKASKPPIPALAFNKNHQARTLTVVAADKTDWSELEVSGAEIVPTGPVHAGDNIKGCRGPVAIRYRPTATLLYSGTFD